jgi:hypothetical protein
VTTNKTQSGNGVCFIQAWYLCCIKGTDKQ